MTSVVGHGAIVVLVYGKSTLKEVQGFAKSWRRKSGVLPLCLGLLLRCCAMAADADAGAPGTSRPGGGGCGFARTWDAPGSGHDAPRNGSRVHGGGRLTARFVHERQPPTEAWAALIGACIWRYPLHGLNHNPGNISI